jgi:hypothetical protein
MRPLGLLRNTSQRRLEELRAARPELLLSGTTVQLREHAATIREAETDIERRGRFPRRDGWAARSPVRQPGSSARPVLFSRGD